MTTNQPKSVFYKFAVIYLLAFASAQLYAQPSDSTIFNDDFDRTELGEFWQAHPSWSIKDGSAYNFIDGTGGSLRTTNGYDAPSYVVETSARGFTSNYMREYRITFGQADLANDSLYVLSYRPYFGGTLSLERSTDNIYAAQPLDEAVIYPSLSADEVYKFKIARYKSGLIQVYVDKGSGYGSVPFLEAIDETYKIAGHIGWQVDTETSPESFYVDNISAVKPGLEKPAVREKPAEDNLITQVSAKSGKEYKVAKLDSGVAQYTDRDYVVTSVPDYLQGASFIQTAMSDKTEVSDTFLTFFVKKAAILYVGYDPRATLIPSWLNSWTKTGDSIRTNDPGTPYLAVYSKLTEYGETYPSPFVLGGNLAGHAYGSEANYIVAAVLPPETMHLQAEDAFLSGAVAENNHPGYAGTGFADYKNLEKDYIEWTVDIKVAGTYNLGFTYTNGTVSDRLLLIEDNGANLDTVSFGSTSSWTWWGYSSGVNTFLTPGIHKIRATAIGTSGPNIDQLSVYYTSSSDTVPAIAKKTPGNNNNLISHFSGQTIKAYPNPFNESTRINYSLTNRAKVFLLVYTGQGQQIETLVNSVQNAGIYQVIFNGAKLAAGTYLYRLQVGNEVKVGKLLKN